MKFTGYAKSCEILGSVRVVAWVAASFALTACGPKFFNEGFLDSLEANDQSVTVGFAPAFVQITDISPTANDPLSLSYGAINGTYAEYCIQENNSNVTSCAWQLGALPASFSPLTDEGNVVLSVWLRDSSGTVSDRVDSNTVYADRVAPQIASVTVTNSTPTNSTSYALAYGASTGTYTQYCLLENDTVVGNCTWNSGSLPAAMTVSNSQNAKTLSLWIRDAAGNTSARRDSNAVTLDTVAPAVSLTSLTGGQMITGGSNTAITWTASDANAGATPISIDVSSDGGSTWTSLATNEANDGSYTWSVPSVTSTTYRVRVSMADTAGNSTSAASTANFTINSTNPVVTVTSPNGGEVFQGGAPATVTWTTSGLPPGAATVKIEISLDNGATWLTEATGEANDGTYTANVNNTFNSQQGLVRVTVTDSLNVDTTDVSDGNVTVDSTPPSVAVTAPNGGGALRGGQVTNITWTASDATYGLATNPISLAYSTDGATWTSIATGEANDGTYAWTVPSVNSQTVKVRVTAVDQAGNSTADASDADFTIDSTAPAIAVTAPNGGETLTGGSSTNITWTASDATYGLAANPITLEYTTDGTNWNTIASGEANDGTYSWTVPGTASTTARVRATVMDSAGNSTSDTSDADFTITAAIYADNFDDNSMDVTFWQDLHGSGECHWCSSLNNYVTYNETSNQMRVSLAAGVGAAYGGYATAHTYDFSGGAYAMVEIPQPGLGTSGCGNFSTGITLLWGGQYTVSFFDEIDSKLVAEVETSTDNWVSVGNVSYNVAMHRWLRIRYDAGASMWRFDRSGNGVTWITEWSRAANFGGSPTAVTIGLYGGNYCNMTTQPTAGRFDNFETNAVRN